MTVRFLCAFLLAAGTLSTYAASPENIISAGDLLPDGNGSADLLAYPVISNGVTVFAATGESPVTDRQIYGGTDSSSIALLVGLGTAIPSGTGSFTSLADPAFYNGRLAFLGNGDSGQSGIYSGPIGSIVRIADLTTLVPGGGGATFDSFDGNGYALNGAGDVVFVGTYGGADTGIFRSSGGLLEAVVTTNDIFPGTGAEFAILEGPAMTDTATYFYGAETTGGLERGIFRLDFSGGSFETIASTLGTNPAGDPWTLFSSPVAGGNAIAFIGDTDSERGMYLYSGDTLQQILKTGDIIPGTETEVANIIAEFALNESGAIIMTVVDEADNRYLLSFMDGQLGVLADTDTLFDGQTPLEGVPSLGIRANGFSGDQAAIYVVTGPGEYGIYTMTVPEPSSVALVAIGATGLLLRRRYVRQRP